MLTKTRYTAIDCLRAVLVIAMIAYHTLWDLVFIYEVNIPWYYTDARQIIQKTIRWSFILLSGFCFSMGRRHIKRGLVLLGCSLVVTAVSLVALEDSPIHFGVLTLLGCATLLTAALHKVFAKCNPFVGVGICLALFLCTEYLQIGKFAGLQMPQWLYANDFTALLGFPPKEFWSSDYVPLIPWLFSYWIGYFTYAVFAKLHWLDLFTKWHCRPLEWIGRHSLMLYMVHQPVVYAILTVIFYFVP
jgi:uncharacterized membrane protein